MANLPPPDHVAYLLEDEPVQPEPTPIILHHAPAQPEGYVEEDGVGDDGYEELEEDGVDDDDDEEEMDEDEDDEDNDGNDNKDEAKVINTYEEVDPLNRPPPTSEEETKFAPPVVPIVDVNDEPVPPVIQFSHNFHVGESSSTGTLLEGNNWVHAPSVI
ncbi:hypothetical protein Tco_1353632 [Tanacetum coccineum]